MEKNFVTICDNGVPERSVLGVRLFACVFVSEAI